VNLEAENFELREENKLKIPVKKKVLRNGKNFSSFVFFANDLFGSGFDSIYLLFLKTSLLKLVFVFIWEKL